MDRPALNELYELTGEGTQTVIDNSSGEVTGDFYRVWWAKTGTVETITIDGQSGTAIDGLQVIRHCILTNVIKIKLTSGIAIGFTR